MDIDNVVSPVLIANFPSEDSSEILEIIEDLKHSRGLDEHSELEKEIWQKYLSLKLLYSGTGDGGGAARTRTHTGGAGGRERQGGGAGVGRTPV